MALSTASLACTTNGDALQRAQDSVRLICGTIAKRRHNGTYTRLEIVTAAGECYETAYWHDNALVSQLDQYGENDTILCQVYFYSHPRYRCWKIWDLLEFSETSGRELRNRLQTIDKSSTRLQAGFEELLWENRCCQDLKGALVHARHLRQQQANVSRLAGLALFSLGIGLSPITCGGTLSMVPGSIVLLCSSCDGAETPGEVQMRHRLTALTRRRNDLQRLAHETFQSARAIESIVAAAKHQPWKRGTCDNYQIFTPPALRTAAALAQQLAGVDPASQQRLI